jgi:hypothetical protein
MAKAAESRWLVRTGADGMPNGLPSDRTETVAAMGECCARRQTVRRLRRERLSVITGTVSRTLSTLGL